MDAQLRLIGFHIENWEDVSPLDILTRYGNHSSNVQKAECSKCSRQWRMGLSCWLEAPISKYLKIKFSVTIAINKSCTYPDECFLNQKINKPVTVNEEFLILRPTSFHELKVTLLSAPVSSELPFCKTTLLRKLLISPILFDRSKIGKKDIVLHGLGNRKICKSQLFH